MSPARKDELCANETPPDLKLERTSVNFREPTTPIGGSRRQSCRVNWKFKKKPNECVGEAEMPTRRWLVPPEPCIARGTRRFAADFFASSIGKRKLPENEAAPQEKVKDDWVISPEFRIERGARRLTTGLLGVKTKGGGADPLPCGSPIDEEARLEAAASRVASPELERQESSAMVDGAKTTNDWVASPGMQHVERTQWTSAASLVASSTDEVKP
ncbi:unnamed protein product [Linum trigynum]|uniref:Uncharacterized protein n=1 Tax=Linum trigynum TaxID=586398 RepID=A0AAV2CK22_9ROSI